MHLPQLVDFSNIIGTQQVDGLPGCEFTVLTFEWDTDGVPTGEHEILACADTDGDILELNEGNNCLTIETDLLVTPNAPYIEADKTFEDAFQAVKSGSAKREEAFEKAFERTNKLDDLLDKKFEEAKKKAKDDTSKPVNPMDMD